MLVFTEITKRKLAVGTADSSSSPPSVSFMQVSSNLQSNASLKELLPVFMFGYYIRPSPNNLDSCDIECISSLSPEFKGLETDISSCRKLKQFIEELAQLTDTSSEVKGTAIDDSNSIGKLKNLFGNTASFLMKTGAFKTKELFSKVQEIQQDMRSPPIVTELPPQLPPRISLTSTTVACSNEEDDILVTKPPDINEPVYDVVFPGNVLPYVHVPLLIEQTIKPCEIIRIPIPFTASPHATLSFEFISRTDHAPYFGVTFIPQEQTSIKIEERVIIPTSAVACIMHVAHAQVPLSLLPSGTIYLLFDNNAPLLTKTLLKQVAYSAQVEHNEVSRCQYTLSVTVQRRQQYILPILILDTNHIDLGFQTQGFEVLFSIVFEPVGSPRRVICPPTKCTSLTGNPFEKIDTRLMVGQILLIWDNTASIVSSRSVYFHLRIAYE